MSQSSDSPTPPTAPHLEIKDAAALLASIVASSDDAIISKTTDGTITSWNVAAETLLGFSAAERIGRSIRDIIPAARQGEEDEILARITAGEHIGNYETTRLNKAGEEVEVSVTISPIRDAAGKIVGASKIIRDITSKKQREREAALLASIVDSSSDAIISKTLDGVITSWNRAAERLFGYAADEIIGRPVRTLIPDDRQDEEDRIIARIRANEVVEPFETIRLRKDGSPFFASITVSPVRDADGRILGASKIARDISAARQSQEQVQSLLREVNHRSKNMLSLIHAIARQSAAGSASDYIERFSARLQALSANQDVLIQNQWRGAWLDELVAAEFAPLDEMFRNRVEVDGPRLRLTPAAAQNVGMILHELTTNAIKFGALSNERGKVSLDWSRDGGRFSIRWIETGGPPPPAVRTTGYGSRVITTLARAAVRGEVDLQFAPEGLRWSLTCPSDKLLAQSENAR